MIKYIYFYEIKYIFFIYKKILINNCFIIYLLNDKVFKKFNINCNK